MLCEELLFATALGAMAEVAFKWGLTLVQECVSDEGTTPIHDEVAAREGSEVPLGPSAARAERVASVLDASGERPLLPLEHQSSINITADIKTWNDSNRRTKDARRSRRQSLGPDGAPCLVVVSSKKTTPPRSRGSNMHLPIGALPVSTAKLSTIVEIAPKKSSINIAADLKTWNDSNRRTKGARSTRRQTMGPESDPRFGASSKKTTPPRGRGSKKSKGAQSIMTKIKQLDVTPSASTASNGSARRRSISPPRSKEADCTGSSKKGSSTSKRAQ